MHLMKQVRSRDYIHRHLRQTLPYVTPRKLANAGLNLVERYRKTPTPASIPPFIKIEPTNLCQLRCVGCQQSRDAFGRRKRGECQMSVEQFRRILEPLAPRLLGISLSLNGEPLMHSDLPALIDEAHRQRVAVSFPTNLSLRLDEAALARLVLSGVDAVYVSLDGASAETYGRYRVGGDFELVLANVKALARTKRYLSHGRPRLVWKFVVFDHNRHEMDLVRERYRDLGFDDYEFVPDRRDPDVTAGRRTYRAKLAQAGRGCYWPWHSMIIQWDGEVRPCCAVPEGFSLGNAITDGSLNVWQSTAYRELREGFRNHDVLAGVCRECLGLGAGQGELGDRRQDGHAAAAGMGN